MILILSIICIANSLLNFYCLFLIDRLENRGLDYLWEHSDPLEPITEEDFYEKNN